MSATVPTQSEECGLSFDFQPVNPLAKTPFLNQTVHDTHDPPTDKTEPDFFRASNGPEGIGHNYPISFRIIQNLGLHTLQRS